MTQQGQETFASLAPDQTPPREERQAGGSSWLGASIWILICFFLQPEQSRVLPLLSKGAGCAEPEAEQPGSSAGGKAWGGSAVTAASTPSGASNSALFSCHQAESRLSSSKSCIRKMSAEDPLHLHIWFGKLVGLAGPKAVRHYIIFPFECWKSVVRPGSACPEREVLGRVSY